MSSDRIDNNPEAAQRIRDAIANGRGDEVPIIVSEITGFPPAPPTPSRQ